MTSDGKHVIVETVEADESVTAENPTSVYNFEVEDWHTYYVGEECVLVHNGCADTQTTKKLSEMFDDELDSLGYKRHSDGSIRDSKGHFAGNSGTVPGTPGVDAAESYLSENGYNVKGKEISVKSSDGKTRRYDIVAEKDGKTYGVEVKSGSARKTSQQAAIDSELISNNGLKTVGKKAKSYDVSQIDSVLDIRFDGNGVRVE